MKIWSTCYVLHGSEKRNDDEQSKISLKVEYEAKLENAEGMIRDMQDEINVMKKSQKVIKMLLFVCKRVCGCVYVCAYLLPNDKF
jgi:hypothetical protein